MSDEKIRTVTVAAVIPARNEAATIEAVVCSVLPFVDQVFVYDGCSGDGTRELAARAGAEVVPDPGRGKGSAIRAAIEDVDADILVLFDADGSHIAEEIPALLAPVLADEADLVVGSRFAGGSEELSVTLGQLVRTIGNISMNIAINKRWGVALSDTLNGFRVVRREAARRVGLREDRHTIEQEMVMKMLAHGYRVENRPAHELARAHGDSHIHIWREWPIFVWCVLRNIVRAKRGPGGSA